MNSAKLKPYTFWLACGGILLLELILALLLSPSYVTKEGDEPKSPADVKQEVDAKMQDLDDLYQRKKNGSPTGHIYDPQNPEDIDKLLKKYLITRVWAEAIEPRVNAFEKQFDAIKAELIKRSAPLNQTVSDQSDPGMWTQEYDRKVTDLLDALSKAKTLNASDGATAADRAKKIDLTIFGGSYPDKAQHRELTTKFNLVALMGEISGRSAVETALNPMLTYGAIATTYQPAVAVARIQRIQFASPGETFKNQVARYVRSYQPFSVTVVGSESSLMAFLAGLEYLEQPIMVVTDARFEHFPPPTPGARKTEIPAQLTATVVALDFSPPDAGGPQ
jgi:hypothetical protein